MEKWKGEGFYTQFLCGASVCDGWAPRSHNFTKRVISLTPWICPWTPSHGQIECAVAYQTTWIASSIPSKQRQLSYQGWAPPCTTDWICLPQRGVTWKDLCVMGYMAVKSIHNRLVFVMGGTTYDLKKYKFKSLIIILEKFLCYLDLDVWRLRQHWRAGVSSAGILHPYNDL